MLRISYCLIELNLQNLKPTIKRELGGRSQVGENGECFLWAWNTHTVFSPLHLSRYFPHLLCNNCNYYVCKHDLNVRSERTSK